MIAAQFRMIAKDGSMTLGILWPKKGERVEILSRKRFFCRGKSRFSLAQIIFLDEGFRWRFEVEKGAREMKLCAERLLKSFRI